jgi:hypothetical protein
MSGPVIRSRPQVEPLEARTLLDAASFVRGLYSDILNRTPSDAEVAGWVSLLNSGTTRQMVAHSFVESIEHRNVFVNGEYMRLLGRPADPTGLTNFVNLMTAGLREDQVDADILSSAEYATKHGGGSNDAFVDGLYHDELNRAADPAGRAAWLADLSLGIPRFTVALGFAQSHERHGIDVTGVYNGVLHRSPDAAGLAFWQQQMDQFARLFLVEEMFASSQEYANDHGFGTHP